MDFLNNEIDPLVLPDADQVNWKPVEKTYLTVLRLQWLIIGVLLFTALAVLTFLIRAFQQQSVMIPLTGGYLALMIIYFILQEKAFRSKAYAIRDHDLLYRHGWIVRSTEVCPFNRVQHCSVHSGPIERRYKLASLTLNTAAAGSGDMKITGLPETFAMGIREFIMKKIATDDGTSH